MSALRHHAADPDVLARTTGLVNFLQEMVRSSHQRQRDDRGRGRERLWLSDLPPQIRKPGARDDGVLLQLKHIPQEPPPDLPELLEGWVDPLACLDPDAGDPPLADEGPVHSRLPVPAGTLQGDEPAVIAQGDAEEVLRAYEPWLNRWRIWAQKERRQQPLRALYDTVYAWHQRLTLEDDRIELILAVGLLTWDKPGQDAVHRHLLVQRAETSVHRGSAEITVRLSAEAAMRLEDQDFLDSGDGWIREQSAALGDEIAASAVHPLDPDTLELLSKWQDRAYQHRIAFSARWQPPESPEAVSRVTYAPALLVRPRNQNALLRLYGKIAETIAAEEYAPLGLAQMVLDGLSAEERAAWDGHGLAQAPLFQGDPLFPGKTNEQQRRVLRRLQKDTGVVVQGPPGTGKTHTIANLVSALLAEGQRVLVTSARDQPLAVLRDKLPKPVRDLCVLLLSSTRSNNGTSELERTVTALTKQVASTDAETLQGEINRLTKRRLDIQGRIGTLTDQLLSVREQEYRHQGVAPGYIGTLAEIVHRVRDHQPSLSWIGALADSTPEHAPLSAQQAQELLVLLREGMGEPRVGGVLPSSETLPASDLVDATFAASRLTSQGLDEQTLQLCDVLAGLDLSPTDEIAGHLDNAATALHYLGLPADPSRWVETWWVCQALVERLAHPQTLLWKRVEDTSEYITQARNALDSVGVRSVHLPESLDVHGAGRMAASGQDLLKHLQTKGQPRVRERFMSLASREQRNAHDLLTLCTIDGQSPRTVDDLEHVLAYLRAHIALDVVAARWKQVKAPLPEGDLEVLLAELDQRHKQLEHIAAFVEARESIDRILVGQGVRFALTTPTAWQVLTRAAGALAHRRAADEALAQLTSWDQYLSATKDGQQPAPEARALSAALREQDSAAYSKAVDDLHAAHERDARRSRCRHLLDRIRSVHPMLSARLLEEAPDPQWDERLAQIERAWAWGAAARFVADRRELGLEQRLDTELGQQEALLEEITGELAATWGRLHCLRNMTSEQRSALQMYQTHMSSLGRGTGRSADRLRAAAKERMRVAQGAVPAWVMPIADVAEMVQTGRNSFDVVIVDEASQASMDALFLLWLAPRVIVVGDDKQCSPPSTGFGRHQAIRDKLAAYLHDMPSGVRELYMPHTNLYGLLSSFFPEVIRLDEHFRCVPEIINWSSANFYDESLLPLRQYGGERLDPLRVTYVEDAATIGREIRIHNPKEAEAIVDALERMTEDAAYRDKTIGVIVLQGHGQTKYIEALIKQRIDPAVRQRHRIQVGNAASFQGDERHVILLSMVVTDPPKIAGGARYEQQAYNVAASRAQDQMWLFHSVPIDRLKPNDMRLNLITYMHNPPTALSALHDIGFVSPKVMQAPFQSMFEQEVYLRLKGRGYHVLPQYPAGTKKIDLVVVGARGRLAVECDGAHFHDTTREQIERDHQRDRELRRVGWEFYRIPESEYRFDADEALTGLWSELNRLDIHPADFTHSPATREASTEWSPLVLTDPDEAEADLAGYGDEPYDADPGESAADFGGAPSQNTQSSALTELGNFCVYDGDDDSEELEQSA
ncbi:AAA domain-containing protein [Streptomyces sp. NPDC020196]|uniref:Superfamily I DNA/RNA helicase n=1 Tax=Streptomyces pratensis (strain ATCC 33331 / IAF-45CD) TaxID=591167 RepID=A0A8D4B9Y7_STRFA|nr:AAA domain-containing protein [Streptomyces sp. SID7815]MYT49448.1 AAA family ATPase [Streptomyces sp. SID7815]